VAVEAESSTFTVFIKRSAMLSDWWSLEAVSEAMKKTVPAAIATPKMAHK
jgi:hypothetical protein